TRLMTGVLSSSFLTSVELTIEIYLNQRIYICIRPCWCGITSSTRCHLRAARPVNTRDRTDISPPVFRQTQCQDPAYRPDAYSRYRSSSCAGRPPAFARNSPYIPVHQSLAPT